MKILNKFIWSKKEPSNKNDIWFDGSTWRMYTEEAWQSFTLPVDAADTLTKMLENASEVYQEKLNAGYGIIIEGNTIYLDVSSIDTDTTYNIGSIELFDQLIRDKSRYELHEDDIKAIQEGKLITTTQFGTKIPVLSVNHMMQSSTSTSIVGYTLIFYVNAVLYNISIYDFEIVGGLSWKTRLDSLAPESYLSSNSYNAIQNATVTKKFEETDAQITELSEENARLKERIEEQDVFIEDLEYHKLTANSDNRYPDLSVGTADNLAGVDVVDSEFNFRRSGGGAISDGVARIEAIKGNSVVWNQLYNRTPLTTSGMTMTIDGNTTIINGVTTASFFSIKGGVRVSANKMLMVVQCLANPDGLSFNVADLNSAMTGINVTASAPNGYAFYTGTYRANGNALGIQRFGDVGTAFNNVKIVVSLYDLTQMFGVGNEPTTIEEFYARIPMGVDLNAYNEGEVIHMDVQSIESVGVNQWGGVLEIGRLDNGEPNTNYIKMAYSPNYIAIIPNCKYYCYTGNIGTAYVYLYVSYYDGEFNFLATTGGLRNKEFIAIPDARYMRFHLYDDESRGFAGYSDICINISDTSINGKYYPYIKRQEDLAVIRKYFPDKMKSAGSAHDEIRYNKQTNKWEKVEAIGIRAYQEGDADNASYLTDGKVTCYPLAEPIVTELDEADQFKDLDYAVWNAGTEKAIAEGKSAPLAADITYGFNAIGKIKELESLVAALRAKVGI